MSKVIFKINSLKQEKDIYKMVQDNLEFLKENKIQFTWPQKSISEEYNEKALTDFKDYLEKKWQQNEKEFCGKLKDFFNIKENDYIIYISNYGTGGCYNLPNRVTINKNFDYDYIRLIKHELIHLIIEPFIKKYKITHNKKENFVNTILELLN